MLSATPAHTPAQNCAMNIESEQRARTQLARNGGEGLLKERAGVAHSKNHQSRTRARALASETVETDEKDLIDDDTER